MIKKINKKLLFRTSILLASLIGIFANTTKEKIDFQNSYIAYVPLVSFEIAHGDDGDGGDGGGGDGGDGAGDGSGGGGSGDGVGACDGGGVGCDGGSSGDGGSEVYSGGGSFSASVCIPESSNESDIFNNAENRDKRYSHKKEYRNDIECGRNVDVIVNIDSINK